MSTYRNTHVTPSVRAANLLKTALTSSSEFDAPHSATAISEAHALIAGEEPYLEKHTSDLLVPRSHLNATGLSDAEVRGAWTSLLNATGDTDWAKLHADGKTQDRLGSAMCSGAYEAVVLQNFALMCKPARVLEIGVFTGTATLALGLLPTVQQIVALDVEPYLKEFCEPYWASAGVWDKIDFKIAPALETLSTMKKSGCEPFDFVFIDADKPSYGAYVQALLDLGLLSQDGVIVADNTLYKGCWVAPEMFKSAETEVDEVERKQLQIQKEAMDGINDFNAFVRKHPELEACVLPIRDGITIIRRTL